MYVMCTAVQMCCYCYNYNEGLHHLTRCTVHVVGTMYNGDPMPCMYVTTVSSIDTVHLKVRVVYSIRARVCTCVVCCLHFTLLHVHHVIYTWLTVHGYILHLTSFTWTACNLQFMCTLTTCSTCTPADGTRYIYSNKYYIQILFGTRTTVVLYKYPTLVPGSPSQQ